MGKSDLLKDSMKSGLDGLLSSTKKSPQKKETTSVKTEVPPEANMGILCRDILEHQQPQGIRAECQGRS